MVKSICSSSVRPGFDSSASMLGGSQSPVIPATNDSMSFYSLHGDIHIGSMKDSYTHIYIKH